ncbi:thioredoxin family protein [Haloarchaeobius amylolyticus]|uniref:thioredoxin family protein n=1 Tax=Haloarchaeobius amylolyticus TaxID=1198296 RepID=UPI00226F192E|nr:thioredoxin domain-containing protein [Haloarchaeobius amylolyticus]
MSNQDELEEIRESKREEIIDQENAADTPDEPVQVEGPDHFQELVGTYDVALVDFYADWCGPCIALGEFIGEVAAETDAAVLKVDVDQQQQLASQFGVQSIPNMLVFKDGEPVQRLVGLKDKSELVAAVEAAA